MRKREKRMFTKMFTDIGGKIKLLAKAGCWIMIAVFVVFGLFVATNSFLDGMLCIVLGCLGSWIGSWALYGMGELIENSTKQRELLTQLLKVETQKKAI